MKDMADCETVLMNELKQWFPKQSQNPYDDYYLWYLTTTSEHNGGLIICKDKPENSDYSLAVGERINKGYTIEQNFHHLRRFLGQLPILEY